MSTARSEANVTEVLPELPLLARPVAPVGPLVDRPERLESLIAELADSAGPVAVDTERASGFRYHNWAYLIQIKTLKDGIRLIDPMALAPADGLADLGQLNRVLAGQEWIIHAASQDLPCLTELGLRPERLFDTELAARLLGRPRVGLGPLVEDVLGVRLLKAHSADDWSTRPLPSDWLVYAALDVDLLIELRDRLAAELAAAGKTGWAEQEFAHWLDWSDKPTPVRRDPWRRTTGIHLVRSPRGLAVVREMWQTRDQLARAADLAPGRMLNDQGISGLATLVTDRSFKLGQAALADNPWFARRQARRHWPDWLEALRRVEELPSDQWPPLRLSGDGPPAPRTWRRSNPVAARRWDQLRPAVNQLAEQHNLPPENLISPDSLRRLAWQPDGSDRTAVWSQFERLGARPWQCDLLAQTVSQVLLEAAS
ncbi:MAG: ribonuclease D [Propionibacteriaceae bacterium]|jgi:ribonuclease D|nr:ribonuclease D [Propionibacteriaceae bacterium]